MAAITFDDYLKTVSPAAAARLQRIREAVQEIAPEAVLTFSYGVPAFKLRKNILLFAGFKQHIGIYPGPEAIVHFKHELSAYEQSKGTVRFPLDAPLPLDLIGNIVRYNLQQLS